MDLESNCAICQSQFFEVFHSPVRQGCGCRSHICQTCARSLPAPRKCPSCRGQSITLEVDTEYLVAVARDVRTAQCEGCHEKMSSRLLSRHLTSCPTYLYSKYAEVMEENAVIRKQYRASIESNTTLRGQMEHNSHVIHYLRSGLETYQNHFGYHHHLLFGGPASSSVAPPRRRRPSAPHPHPPPPPPPPSTQGHSVNVVVHSDDTGDDDEDDDDDDDMDTEASSEEEEEEGEVEEVLMTHFVSAETTAASAPPQSPAPSLEETAGPPTLLQALRLARPRLIPPSPSPMGVA